MLSPQEAAALLLLEGQELSMAHDYGPWQSYNMLDYTLREKKHREDCRKCALRKFIQEKKPESKEAADMEAYGRMHD